MGGESRLKPRLLCIIAGTLCLGIVGLLGLYDSFPTGCIMTYMYPTYIPVPPPANTSATKYGLFLYHEGWKKVDHQLKLIQLSGVPVLFIPGNGGSYKQVRSLAAESDRAYNGGPQEESFYKAGTLTPEELLNGYEANGVNGAKGEVLYRRLEKQYYNHLDWFTVDLDGEHSAMDGRILEEHTEYVVQAIHRILDRYKESFEARSKDTTDLASTLPKSVILVGHSMGGFVARAAVVHSGLRKDAIQTVVTLSSPHMSPPVATQPSLGYYFSRVNRAWRKGYDSGWKSSASTPSLSNVVVISIVGGARDYQVRSKIASLDGIVPPTHGLTIGTPGMVNVWLGMEHQSILWCNQLVVQVSHTLLQLIDRKSGQPFLSPSKRLETFSLNLRSALPQTFGWMAHDQHQLTNHMLKPSGLLKGGNDTIFLSKDYYLKPTGLLKGGNVGDDDFNSEDAVDEFSCPRSVKWFDDSHEKDLYIETYTVTVLAMDGRRRWMDIKKLGSNGRDHFVMVTNLVPCLGIRIHLWPEKDGKEGLSINQRMIDVTRKMVQIPAGPAPRQIEPGGQTEQAPPSGILGLSPEDLQGFRFLTISVAPRPTISGRPPPAASMAVGQFYKPSEGAITPSSSWFMSTALGQKDIQLVENHPLVVNASFPLSLGVLPLNMEVKTSSCGIRNAVFANEDPNDREHTALCKLRCFPPVALIWDPATGLAVIPNFYSEMIAVDSSPALWGPRRGSQKQTILLLVDPHCAYKVSMGVSISAAATRFLLIHGLEIAGFAVSILLFALMHQARRWELDQPVPSVLASMEHNLSFPFPFILLNVIPLSIYAICGFLGSDRTSSFLSFVIVSVVCYCFAIGAVALLATLAHILFYAFASMQVFLKLRCKASVHLSNMRTPAVLQTHINRIRPLWVVGYVKSRPSLTIMVLSILLVCFLHPALGLIVLLIAHAWRCYSALCSCLAACSRSQQHQNNSLHVGQIVETQMVPAKNDGSYMGSPKTIISFGDTQLEIFNYGQGLLLLHLIAAAMLIPSLVAWGQRLGMDRSLPWLLDASLTLGIIFHGYLGNKLDVNIPLVPVPGLLGGSQSDSGLSFVYGAAGLYSYLAGLALSPYKVFYALAIIGLVTAIFRHLDKKGRTKGDYSSKRRHFHRH